MKLAPTYTYDDIILAPQYSNIKSRNHIALVTDIANFYFELPIMSSPMDTVTEEAMAKAMTEAGGLGIIHRYNSIEEQVDIFSRSPANTACAIGVKDSIPRIDALEKAGCRIFCIDVAHGHHALVVDAIKAIRRLYDNLVIIAGNIATGEGYYTLAAAGVDAVRAGVGGGCFLAGTTIKVFNSDDKPIEDVEVGDFVLTHKNRYREVLDTTTLYKDEELVEINGITSTTSHEYFVVKCNDALLVTEENYLEYGFWLQASELSDEYLLVELD